MTASIPKVFLTSGHADDGGGNNYCVTRSPDLLRWERQAVTVRDVPISFATATIHSSERWKPENDQVQRDSRLFPVFLNDNRRESKVCRWESEKATISMTVTGGEKIASAGLTTDQGGMCLIDLPHQRNYQKKPCHDATEIDPNPSVEPRFKVQRATRKLR